MPLALDSKTTALVLIDLQHGIMGMPVQPHSADAVMKASSKMAEAFREKGARVVYVRVDMNNLMPLIVDRSRMNPNAGPFPAMASELVPAAGFQESDLLITKRHWSAFGQTEMEDTLKNMGVTTIVLGGVATNFGVESTARHAVAVGFQVVIAEDACSTLEAEAHTFAMEKIFPMIGRVSTSGEIIHALA
jgi:nicotinamidase-related amidase